MGVNVALGGGSLDSHDNSDIKIRRELYVWDLYRAKQHTPVMTRTHPSIPSMVYSFY